MLPPEPNIGDVLTCPVCQKQFKASADTKYILKDGYTCSWKCFLDHVRAHPAPPKEEKKKKPQPRVLIKMPTVAPSIEEDPKSDTPKPQSDKEELW